MPLRFELMLIVGFVLVLTGTATRTYMNIVIDRSPLAGNTFTRSTELRYRRLVREQGAPLWPLAVTVACVPLGIVIAFAAVILS